MVTFKGKKRKKIKRIFGVSFDKIIIIKLIVVLNVYT